MTDSFRHPDLEPGPGGKIWEQERIEIRERKEREDKEFERKYGGKNYSNSGFKGGNRCMDTIYKDDD